MKKTLALILALTMLLSSAVCFGEAAAPYPETVKLTSFFEISGPIANSFDQKYLSGPEELALLKAIREDTNVEIEYLWYATDSAEDSDTKKNTAIATGDIPDFMVVNSTQLALLAKSNLINKDMGAIFDAYASEHLKEFTLSMDGAAMSAATFDGKVIAIPLAASSMGTIPVMWIRQDWLNNLGLEVPETMDDLYEVMRAFTEDDPDGNGENDTVGVSLMKTYLSMGLCDATGFFNGFGAYPTHWVPDGNGGLKYGVDTQEARDALAFMAKLFEDGLISEDFSTMDDGGIMAQLVGGEAGLSFGANWNFAWPHSMTSMNDPACDWIPVSIPGVGGIGVPQSSLSLNGYVVVSAECEYPEAVVKLINAWVEERYFSTEEEYVSYCVDQDGTGVPMIPQHYIMLKNSSMTDTLDAYKAVKEALETDNPSILTPEYMNYYNQIMNFRAGQTDMDSLMGAKTYGPENSSMAAINAYFENGSVEVDLFTGAATPTMGKKMSLVTDKVLEYYTKVIMGVESLDNYDEFLAELNNLGLADITSEVNEWYAAK